MTYIEISKRENAFIQKNIYDKQGVIIWELCTKQTETEITIHCELAYDVVRKWFSHCQVIEKNSVALNFRPEPTQRGHITQFKHN